jgi:hypothetical protein
MDDYIQCFGYLNSRPNKTEHCVYTTSLGLRWLDEFNAKNRFEGNTFFITLGYIVKSLEKKKE